MSVLPVRGTSARQAGELCSPSLLSTGGSSNARLMGASVGALWVALLGLLGSLQFLQGLKDFSALSNVAKRCKCWTSQ